MKPWRRLVLYLVLNILVSTITTVVVLVAWDRLRGPLPSNLIPEISWDLFKSAPATPDAPQNTPQPQPTPTETFIVYQVQAGDTFESIANQYNVSIDLLLAENGFSADTLLGVGETLRIPVMPRGPDPGAVVIDRVVGAGDLATERVVIAYTGSEELSLAGWALEAPAGQLYRFPQLTLFRDGAVSIYTKAGSDTVVDLYWGLGTAVWARGDRVDLRSPDGEVYASYIVP